MRYIIFDSPPPDISNLSFIHLPWEIVWFKYGDMSLDPNRRPVDLGIKKKATCECEVAV